MVGRKGFTRFRVAHSAQRHDGPISRMPRSQG